MPHMSVFTQVLTNQYGCPDWCLFVEFYEIKPTRFKTVQITDKAKHFFNKNRDPKAIADLWERLTGEKLIVL